MAEASSTPVQFPHKLDAALSELKLISTHPALFKTLHGWWTDEAEKFFVVKKNGSGKQVVLKYDPLIFLGFIKLALAASTTRADLTRSRKEAYAAVMTASGLFSGENISTLLGVSRTQASAWGVQRSPRYPATRIGGAINHEALHAAAAWWQAKVNKTDSVAAEWLLILANRQGISWTVLARLTGRSMYQMRRDIQRAEHSRVREISIVVNNPATAEPTDAGSARYLPQRSVSRPTESDLSQDGVPDETGFEESLIKPPITDTHGDAFASAAYLSAVPEADSHDAGQPDASEDGVHEGGQSDRRDGSEEADRGVHPFFQQE